MHLHAQRPFAPSQSLRNLAVSQTLRSVEPEQLPARFAYPLHDGVPEAAALPTEKPALLSRRGLRKVLIGWKLSADLAHVVHRSPVGQ